MGTQSVFWSQSFASAGAWLKPLQSRAAGLVTNPSGLRASGFQSREQYGNIARAKIAEMILGGPRLSLC